MKTVANFVGTDEYELQMTITMKLGAWRRLYDTLSIDWPASDIRDQIRAAIAKATNQINAETSRG